MRMARLFVFGLFCLGGCSEAPITGPSVAPPTVTPPAPPPSASLKAEYAVTLAASSACAVELPTAARERSYTAKFFADGHVEWRAPTLRPPLGHGATSSGTVEAGAVSFSIDVERDPQSDDFHGLWDALSGDTWVQISGKGSVAQTGERLTGTLDGLFAFYEPHVPANPGVLIDGRYCQAKDHRVTFVKQ